jgi:hypothetical protein
MRRGISIWIALDRIINYQMSVKHFCKSGGLDFREQSRSRFLDCQDFFFQTVDNFLTDLQTYKNV